MKFTRRRALQSMGVGLLSMNLPVWAQNNLVQGLTKESRLPLYGPDANGFLLPEGFCSRVVGYSGQYVVGTGYEWHHAPDGGAVVPTEDGGWIYVSNSETSVNIGNPRGGGVGAIRFSSEGEIVGAFRLLSHTTHNCAGGLTPWGTWLSCEEFESKKNILSDDVFGKKKYQAGRVWETFPLNPSREAIAHPQMGVFKHEAAAFDSEGRVYLTEDTPDGCFYRYLPETEGDLSQGELQVAVVSDHGDMTWVTVPDPEVVNGKPTRLQVSEATHFNGGEGCAFHEGVIYFTTKGDNKVWAFDVDGEKLSVLYDKEKSDTPVLSGVDNIAISPAGQVMVAEDGGNMELVGVNSKGEAVPVLRLLRHGRSEFTGPAFSPDGQRLYISSQRGLGGKDSTGMTFEITGPFQDLVI